MRGQLRVFRPEAGRERSRRIEILRMPKWKKHVGQNLSDPRFANERHSRRRGVGGEGVMKIPKWMIESLKKIARGRRERFSSGTRSSILEFSLHPHRRRLADENGAHWRIAGR